MINLFEIQIILNCQTNFIIPARYLEREVENYTELIPNTIPFKCSFCASGKTFYIEHSYIEFSENYLDFVKNCGISNLVLAIQMCIRFHFLLLPGKLFFLQ